MPTLPQSVHWERAGLCRLQRHILQNSGHCALYSQAAETIHHLLLGCSYNREVWFRVSGRAGLQHLAPSSDDRLDVWWLRLPSATCQLDGERNDRVFNNTSQQAFQLTSKIADEVAK
jgi:hypothetical protein